MSEFHTDAQIARYNLVHKFKKGNKKGAEALAPLVNMNTGTLNNKVNYNLDSHHLTADENVAIQAATGNFEPIKADAIALGGVFTKLPEHIEDFNDDELLKAYLAMVKDIGETADMFNKAMEDGKIDAQELADIRRECFEDITRIMTLMKVITERHEQEVAK